MRLVTLSSPRDKPHERLRSKRVQQIIVSNETDQLHWIELLSYFRNQSCFSKEIYLNWYKGRFPLDQKFRSSFSEVD